jgi:hypothetical protein
MMRRFVAGALGSIVLLSVALLKSSGADTLPAQIPDAEFWRMVSEFSEPDGFFQFENYVSNEPTYQVVLPQVTQLVKPGGAYLGVAPEQNFTYIAATKPQIAFIVDIRRQNMIELLVYKALFEIAPDRRAFVSRLFSRKPPAGLAAAATAEELFRAYGSVAADGQLLTETVQAVKDRLNQRGFKPVGDDEQKMVAILNVFREGGPGMDYGFGSARRPVATLPSYYTLMVATDGKGKAWSYLASEDNYRFVREMQQRNLIVPLVGDFGGPKAIKAVGAYLKNHGATTRVFYVSNVEDYLQASWASYLSNLAALPQDDTTLLIRFDPNMDKPITSLRLMKDSPRDWPGRSWR